MSPLRREQGSLRQHFATPTKSAIRCSQGNWLTGAGDSCGLTSRRERGRVKGRETDRGVKSVGRESSCLEKVWAQLFPGLIYSRISARVLFLYGWKTSLCAVMLPYSMLFAIPVRRRIRSPTIRVEDRKSSLRSKIGVVRRKDLPPAAARRGSMSFGKL